MVEIQELGALDLDSTMNALLALPFHPCLLPAILSDVAASNLHEVSNLGQKRRVAFPRRPSQTTRKTCFERGAGEGLRPREQTVRPRRSSSQGPQSRDSISPVH